MQGLSFFSHMTETLPWMFEDTGNQQIPTDHTLGGSKGLTAQLEKPKLDLHPADCCVWGLILFYLQVNKLALQAFPGGSVVKNVFQCRRLGFEDQEDPLEKEMTTHSSILAWRIPWAEEPGGLQFMWSQKSWTQLRDNKLAF